MQSGRFPEIEHREAHGKRSAALGKRASGHFWPSQGYRNLGEAVAASRRLGLSRTCSLRAVEICDLEWSQVEFDRTATLHVRRAKNGKSQRTRFGATSCGRFVSYSARPAAATCLRRSAVPRPPAALGRRGEQHGFSGETWTECHGTAARTRRYIFPHHGFKHKQNRR